MPRAFAVSFGFGHYDLPGLFGAGYNYWNAGLAYDWRAWHFDVSYIGSSSEIRDTPYMHSAMNPGMNSVPRQQFYNENSGNRVAAIILWRF